MRILVILTATLFLSSVFAIDNCVDYLLPQRDISKLKLEESKELSFKDCPSSLLMNDKRVLPLHMVEKNGEDNFCIYTASNVVLLKCKR